MTLWRPRCPCDAGCLPERRHTVPILVRLGRWIGAAAALARAMTRPRDASGSAARILAALGIRWSVVGAPVAPGTLLVGNHVSFLDILVIMAFGNGSGLRMVAKAEVGGWPVVGRLARACGTIFVDRARPRALPDTVAEVTRALRQAYPVQVFPEGTTTCGFHGVPWRPAFLQAAIDAGAPVQRFTLLFSTPVAAFVEGETLLAAVRRVIAARNLSVTVFVDEPVVPRGNRRRMARRLSHHQRVDDRSRA